MALELFALQYDLNHPYQQLCSARGLRPGGLSSWEQIPAMPVSGFKEYSVTCIPETERTGFFQSSGTTANRLSCHFHHAASLEVYEQSLWEWFRCQVSPPNADAVERVPTLSEWFRRQVPAPLGDFELVILSPTPAEAPHSSLVHMFDTIRRRINDDSDVFCAETGPDNAWVLNAARCRERVRRVAGKRTLVLGAAFSYVHLLDLPGIEPVKLPPGSVVFETGGYKGRSRSMEKSELHQHMCGFFGVEPRQLLCEYGMSEISSQAYENGGAFVFPPWARARVVSAGTGREVAEGESGLIEIVDLANVFSVCAVRTQDVGVRRANGFALLGRAPSSEPRGCSLALGSEDQSE